MENVERDVCVVRDKIERDEAKAEREIEGTINEYEDMPWENIKIKFILWAAKGKFYRIWLQNKAYVISRFLKLFYYFLFYQIWDLVK